MALWRRFLCWNLRTASFANFITITILAFGATLLRYLDLVTIITDMEIDHQIRRPEDDFEISQGFRNEWRSHQWQAFLASDIILLFCHHVIIIFSLYMIYMVTQHHFVLYMEKLRNFTYTFIMYIFIEFCFSVFEFSFYGLNTFRLAYVVFIWLYWLARTLGNILMTVVFFSRMQEMEDDMAYELKSSGKKYIHSYSALS